MVVVVEGGDGGGWGRGGRRGEEGEKASKHTHTPDAPNEGIYDEHDWPPVVPKQAQAEVVVPVLQTETHSVHRCQQAHNTGPRPL